jgi:hypothetical protein
MVSRRLAGLYMAGLNSVFKPLFQYDSSNPKTQKNKWSELGIGCENCHGHGALHVKRKSKKDIWNFADKPKGDQSSVCGYCHSRFENFKYKSA